MQTSSSTTPFGRRPFSLAQMASQVAANRSRRRRPSSTNGRSSTPSGGQGGARRLRPLARGSVRAADLPSRRPCSAGDDHHRLPFEQNSGAAGQRHGARTPCAGTWRSLVASGLIIRRDSPNGKRYARKGEGGEIEKAFGFDLTPIVARADEFQRLAAEAKAEELVLRHLRERITICRRDIDKMIATGSL